MAITLITGVPGTGKTAFLVSELERIAATGRKIFVDNVSGLKIEHYRAGKITDWQKGTWLHIDQYKRTAPSLVMGGVGDRSLQNCPLQDEDEDDDDGNENWTPNPEVLKDKDDYLHRVVFDDCGQVVGSVPYESHKGALLVIDEAQRHFRPRPSGSAVPDHVAALEVHRHQGIDIWLVTQRPGLIDSNVRALCGKHIAFRATPFGRYKYEWPEVGDIESKMSRDTAAKSRFKLPKHVFQLYKSAEVHTMHKHKLPLVAKALFLIVPIFLALIYQSTSLIKGKFDPVAVAQAQPVQQQSSGDIRNAALHKNSSQAPAKEQALPFGLVAYDAKEIEGRHPFERQQFSIVGRVQSASKDVYRFSVSENGQHSFYISSGDLKTAGYDVLSINDCSVKLVYKLHEFFVTCNVQRVQQVTYEPAQALQPHAMSPLPPPVILQPYP